MEGSKVVNTRETPSEPFALGPCRVNPAANTVTGPAGKTNVEPKVMAVLLVLAARPRDVVTREEFVNTIWSNEFGGDESLTRAVSLLRKALGDGRGAQSIIETVPRKGYRLLVTPGATTEAEADATPPAREPSGTSWVRTAGLTLLAALAIILVVDRLGMTRDKPLRALPAEARPVIAVLPFDSQTPVEEDRYLAAGLADETLSALAKRQTASVIAGNSSFLFRGDAKKDLETIARQLEATHVVDGSVRRTGAGLRVSVHLVNTRSGLMTWSDVFEGEEHEVYAIPGAVASSILASLGLRPAVTEATPGSTPDPAAYRYYLQAQALLRESTTTGLQRSIGYFLQAVEQDPEIAEAWAALALARLYVMLVQPGKETSGFRNRDPEERLAMARAEAERALALDSESVEARLALLIIDYRARLVPLAEAERRFRALAERAPAHPEANMRAGMMMLELGRFEESMEYFERSARLDPLSLQAGSFYIQALRHAGRTQAAQAFIDSGRCPWYPESFLHLERLLVEKDFAGARAWLEGVAPRAYFAPHGAYGQSGERTIESSPLYDKLVRLVALAESLDPAAESSLSGALIEAADRGQMLHYYAAVLLGGAGVEDPVFELVQRRLAVDDLFFRGALFRDSLANLRDDPRVMAWFDASTHLDYWLDGGALPDFCSDPALPYNCLEAARAYRAGPSAP